jgi:hypothetical protein
MKTSFETEIIGHVLVQNADTKEVLLDKHNAIHSINMARAIARGLAKEPNYYVYRLAMGNGGSFVDAASNVVLRPPNDGNNGDGWESRLYNETYSEVVDESDANFKLNVSGKGGGAVPADDPAGGGVISQEVGSKSNVIVTMYINQNEPTGQLSSSSVSSPVGEETDFIFNEIGLYTSGKPPQATNGTSGVNVGNKLSTDELPISPGLTLTMSVIVDDVARSGTISIPSAGTGANGAITFGDFCEGFNSGGWITSGDSINTYLYSYITDRSGGEYPSIIGKESFGFLTFESKTTGVTSSVSLSCDPSVATNFWNVLTGGICGNCNVNQFSGSDAGVQNDPITPTNERERLLTHLTFQPLTKAFDVSIQITYTLTISVKPSQDSSISQVLTTV